MFQAHGQALPVDQPWTRSAQFPFDLLLFTPYFSMFHDSGLEPRTHFIRKYGLQRPLPLLVAFYSQDHEVYSR